MTDERIADGLYSFLYPGDGDPIISLRYTGEYKNGKRHGLWRVQHPDDSPAHDIGWNYGEWDGVAIAWWRNGTKRQEGSHSQGRRTGVWSFWFANGQLAAHGEYSTDRKVGRWEYFDETGTPQAYEDWQRECEQYDWAYDDYTNFPHGKNWPHPPLGSQPISR
jgi:antitoxin component YwqK of YwqJK toxin-antitoxin module